MPTTRRLLRKEITHSYAKEDDTNVLHQLTYWDQREKFFKLLYEKRNLIAAAVTHHLGLNSKVTCQIAEMKDWLHGSFNVCIPIIIYGSRKYAGKWMMIRFPLPYRVGEAFRPGNADEKLRTEAGAYAWLQENCPSVPIPHLYGFALSTGQTVCKLQYFTKLL